MQVALDVVTLTGAFIFAFLLRFEFLLTAPHRRLLLYQLPMVLTIQVGAFLAFGIYRFIWRYVGLDVLRAFAGASAVTTTVLVVLRYTLPDSLLLWRVPLSIILINTAFAYTGTLGMRVLRRLLFEFQEKERNACERAAEDSRERVLLVGAGRAGLLAAKEIASRTDLGYDIVGFADDDPTKLGSRVQGCPVLGPTTDVPRLVEQHAVSSIIITIARASRREIRRIVEICEKCGVRIRIIPGLYEILGGRVKVSQIRDVDIADLLGREPVRLDDERIRLFLSGRRVLVSGAGGSIGSELVRQVARFSPLEILLVERAEYALYRIDEEMGRLFPNLKRVPLLADVTDGARIRDIFRAHKPQVVIHAAAHKHVPLVELNPGEAVKNNVFGALTIGEIAGRFGVETFILISTDKAVNPTSVMGATKRATELVGQMLGKRFPTKFVAVRFGNVLDSAGSVIPKFREQIARGGPVTVTHPEMRRYFMTIPEAAQLVLEAASLGKGGEIFLLDMGEPVRIVDLATDMITLSGFRPHEDIEIVFTGIRPGEKLFEELGTTAEQADRTTHGKVFVLRNAEVVPERVAASLPRLRDLAENGNSKALRRELEMMIPEARLMDPPSETSLRTVDGSGKRAGVVPMPMRGK